MVNRENKKRLTQLNPLPTQAGITQRRIHNKAILPIIRSIMSQVVDKYQSKVKTQDRV